MYSLPTSTTLAVLTIASAASTEPINPRVSTIPSASDVMKWREYHSTRDAQIFRILHTDAPDLDDCLLWAPTRRCETGRIRFGIRDPPSRRVRYADGTRCG